MNYRSILLFFSLTTLCIIHAQDEQQDEQIKELLPSYCAYKLKATEATIDYFHALFLTQYGPIHWKELYWGWDVNTQIDIAKQSLYNLKEIKCSHLKPIFNRLLNSAQDGHVSISYVGNTIASLPIRADLVDGQVFVTESEFAGIKIGDQILSINYQPILEYASHELHHSTWELAPLAKPQYDLTRVFVRNSAYDAIPEDMDSPVKVTILRGEKLLSFSIIWDVFTSKEEFEEITDEYSTSQPNPIHKLFSQKHSVPPLRQLHQHMALTSRRGLADPSTPHWYINTIGSQKIGYLRLPSFDKESMMKIINEAVTNFEDQVDGVIVDIRDNPGGYDLVCFAALSRLIESPLVNVTESSLLSEAAAYEARESVDYFQTQLIDALCDEDLHNKWGSSHFKGYYLTLDNAKEMMLYASLLNEEWQKGHSCSSFTPCSGIAMIQPHPKYRYTGPLFVLIDERTGSNGDLFAATMQDNGRALVIGRTSAGLGGSILHYDMPPNFIGIQAFGLTSSLVLRSNQRVIEDLGITPDVEIERTASMIIKPRLELDYVFDWVADHLKKN